MLEGLRALVVQAIRERVKGRLELGHSQKHIAQEFGVSKTDISLLALGKENCMSLERLLKVAHGMGIKLMASCWTDAGADHAFTLALTRIKHAAADELEALAQKRLDKARGQPAPFADEEYPV